MVWSGLVWIAHRPRPGSSSNPHPTIHDDQPLQVAQNAKTCKLSPGQVYNRPVHDENCPRDSLQFLQAANCPGDKFAHARDECKLVPGTVCTFSRFGPLAGVGHHALSDVDSRMHPGGVGEGTTRMHGGVDAGPRMIRWGFADESAKLRWMAGLVWPGLGWSGVVWNGLECFGVAWFGLAWSGPVGFGLVRMVWSGLLWHYLVCLGTYAVIGSGWPGSGVTCHGLV